MQNLSIFYSAINLILFAIVASTPQPYHPRDLQADSYENLEIKDGTIYRNVSLLVRYEKMEEITDFLISYHNRILN